VFYVSFRKQKKKAVALLLFVSFFLSFAAISAPVKADDYGQITINASGSECASITVTGSGYSSTFTSFPDVFTIEVFDDYLTFSVTAQAGYEFSYAVSGETAYLDNPFSDYFYGSYDISFYFGDAPAPTPTPMPTPTLAPGEPTPTPPVSPTGYQYIFSGLCDENNAGSLLGNVSVTSYYSNGNHGIAGTSVERFTVLTSESYIYEPPAKPLYFSFDLSQHYGANMTRQYWLGKTENTASIPIYATNNDLSTIAFSIFNYKMIDAFGSGAILTARSITNNNAIDRRLTDSVGTATLNLQPNTLYLLTIESVSTGTSYTLGPINTANTLITMTVPALSFPSSLISLYTYSYMFAYRNFTTHSLSIAYEDTTNSTGSLELIISTQNSTVYYDHTFINGIDNVNLFGYTWTSADNATDYNVWLVVNSTTSGVYYFKQFLLGENNVVESPFSFAFLGSIEGFDTAIFIPAFLIIGAAGCFSQLSAEVAAFLTTVTAVILVLIGWISISNSMLVIALSLSVLSGVVAARRRFG
jgi:hypothetical protein